MFVTLLHLNIHFGLSNTFIRDILPWEIFRLLFWSGFYGVVIFFTLSGYLITNSVIKKWGSLKNISVKTFYWFRFARIMPLLLLTLTVLSILHIFKVDGFVIDADKTSLSRALIAALTFHMNWLEIKVGYLPANWDVLWSISIEETFYLSFPLICFFFLKKDWKFIFVLVICLLISPWARTHLFVGNELADKNHLAYLDAIALGCFSALVASKAIVKGNLKLFIFILGSIMVTLVLLFRGIIYKNGIVELGLDITILSVGVSLLLLFLHNANYNLSLFKWLENFGKYSYEIYLTHMFVIIVGVKFFKYLELNDNWIIPFGLLLITLSYALGKLLFEYFSEPVNMKLRQKWIESDASSQAGQNALSKREHHL